jgi:2-polyprenyl-3-methyl-5-hydroxy-6-metoxy-1,4-benzoquinol methylase
VLKKLKNRYLNYKIKEAFKSKNVEERFTYIYNKKLWFKNGDSESGAGSTLKATENLRKDLVDFLLRVNGTALLDVGCGDFNWMKEIELPCPYIGVDIVKSVIERNKAKYTSDKISFRHLNAVNEELPDDADVIICREVLFHLSFEDGIQVLNKVKKSNARYFIATTNRSIDKNIDVNSGEFRNINLLLPPYDLKSDYKEIDDSSISKDRMLGIWKLH